MLQISNMTITFLDYVADWWEGTHRGICNKYLIDMVTVIRKERVLHKAIS